MAVNLLSLKTEFFFNNFQLIYKEHIQVGEKKDVRSIKNQNELPSPSYTNPTVLSQNKFKGKLSRDCLFVWLVFLIICLEESVINLYCS